MIDASLGEEEPGAPLAAFPILFGWASGAPEITVGVGVDGERLEQVETLGRALLACVGSQPEEAVEVQVRGFADVNEFQNQSKDQQAELNLKAAHLRAESVSLILRDLEDEQGRHLTVLPKVQWSRIEEMLRFKLYLDRPFREAGGRDQGLFNRRAEVLIHATGACLPTERTPSRKRIQQAETGSKSTSAVRRVAGVGSR